MTVVYGVVLPCSRNSKNGVNLTWHRCSAMSPLGRRKRSPAWCGWRWGDVMKKVQDSSRMSLEFDSSTVRVGTVSTILEYKYRIKGKRLEVIVDAMGQKAVLPMTLEDDGSISYMGLRYRKVR